MINLLIVILSIGAGALCLWKHNLSISTYCIVMFFQAWALAYTNNNWSSLGTLLTALALIIT